MFQMRSISIKKKLHKLLQDRPKQAVLKVLKIQIKQVNKPNSLPQHQSFNLTNDKH